MHLIDALVSGVSSAANGTVTLKRRGTSTYATYYTDFEGTVAVTPTAGVALDTYGGAVVYVSEMVDCKVYDSSGTLVRSFVAGVGAGDVEAITQSFTGVGYGSGASGASLPITLAAILDLWKTNAGAVDWKVLVNGVATTLQSAVASFSGFFFNVKDPAYGAAGNGTADDSVAIAAAITAAQVAGGIVFFPPGTYRLTTGLTIGTQVSLMGAGAYASFIKMDAAATVIVTYSGTTAKDWQFIHGLRFGNAQANSAYLIHSAVNLHLRIDECYIGDSSTTGGCIQTDTSTTQILMCTNTTFELGSDTARAINGGSYVVLSGCSFPLPATYNTVAVLGDKGLMMTNCFFGCSTVTSGAFGCAQCTTAVKPNVIVGCDFPNPGGSATCTAMYVSATNDFAEYGNRIGTGSAMTAYGGSGAAATATRSGMVFGSRDSREVAYDSDISLTAAIDQYGVARVKRGAGYASATTLTLGAPLSPGQRATIAYHNSSAGGTTGTVTVTTVKGLASFTVNASSASLYHLLSADINGSLSWVLAGSSANFTP